MLECIYIYIIFLLHVTLSRLSRSKPKSPTEVCYRNTLKNAWHCVTAWHRTLPVKQPNYKLIFIYYYSNTYFIQILILFKYLFIFRILIFIYYSNTYFIQILILFIIQILILFKYLFYSNTYLLFYSNTYLLFYSNTYFIHYSNIYFIQILLLHVGHRSPSVTHFQKFSQGDSLKKNFEKRVTEGDRGPNHKNTEP
jgi:hypothetical protein